jgi:hypothetical protein
VTLRDELIQVAAVAVAIVTDLDGGSTRMQTTTTPTVIQDVMRERLRQEDKWGAQHHPIEWWLAILGEEVGEACEEPLDVEFYPGDEPTPWALMIDGAEWGRRCKDALTDKFGVKP